MSENVWNLKKEFKTLQSNNLLMAFAVGAGIYLVYKALKTGKEIVDTTTGAISAPIASFITWITSNKPNVASGTIIFQSGNTLPASAITLQDVKPGENFSRFTYMGQQYKLYARTSNGYYPAVLA